MRKQKKAKSLTVCAECGSEKDLHYCYGRRENGFNWNEVLNMLPLEGRTLCRTCQSKYL